MSQLIHHFLSDSAQRIPEKTVFRYCETSISYGKLDKRSNQLARVLSGSGVKRSDRIGIYMNKCIEMPIAVYGVLKAGGSYVPIDPTAPLERIRFIIENCGIRILITQNSKARQVLKLLDGCTALEMIVGLDGACDRTLSWKQVFEGDEGPLADTANESDLAYIMYTSGSTGMPKGLMHTHRSGRSYATHSAQLYGVCSEDILGNHSPLHFDMSLFEVMTGPFCGSTSVLIPEETMMFPVSLALLIEKEQLTIWYSVPWALIQLVNQGQLEDRDLSALRWINFAGEPFPPKYLRKLMDLVPNARYSNVYGPAEVNQCTYYNVPADFPSDAESVPIGQVWPGAIGKIIDSEDNDVSTGRSGELVICSQTMMRGYWNRDDLNKSAFLKVTNSKGVEDIYYRTGDLVRESEQGELLFLGRKDRQIKVRGFRIELDEIENVLVQENSVQEVAAVAIANREGTNEICCAVTLKPGLEVHESDLRAFASKRLPAYGVPSRMKFYASFPRTTSGKIDRTSLSLDFQTETRG